MKLAVVKAHDWGSWSARHARGEVAGALGPYGAEQLQSHGIALRWSDHSHTQPWSSPLLKRPLRKLGTLRPELIGAHEALASIRAVSGADATLALFEDQALAAAYARTKHLAPFARRPLVLIACWLAENCTDFDAATRDAYRRALMGADRVCFFSQNQTEILERELGLPAARLCCVPFGIDTEFFTTSADTDAGYILAIGRDVGRDHHTLLEAVRGTELPLQLVAPQPELATLAPPNVKLVQTTVEHREYRALLAGASVVAVPTHAPAYPSGQTVVLEAMAMGKAVVTTDSPAMRDYVQDGRTGMLVAAHEPRALGEALTALMADAQLRQTLGSAAREQVHQRFSHRTMWAALADVLSDLVPQAR